MYHMLVGESQKTLDYCSNASKSGKDVFVVWPLASMNICNVFEPFTIPIYGLICNIGL